MSAIISNGVSGISKVTKPAVAKMATGAANKAAVLGPEVFQQGIQQAAEGLSHLSLEHAIEIARPLWESVKGAWSNPETRHQAIEFVRQALTQVLRLEADAGWQKIALKLLGVLLTRRR